MAAFIVKPAGGPDGNCNEPTSQLPGMDARDLAILAAVVVAFAALSVTYTPVTGLAVSAFLGFFLVAAFRYRDIRW